MNLTTLIRIRCGYIAIFGDAAVFIIFATLGSEEHNIILTQSLIRTGLPFLVVWFTITPLFGMYNQLFLENSRKSILTIMVIWPLCAIIALGIRNVVTEQNTNLSFVIISFLIQGSLLGAWRYAFAKLLKLFCR